MKTFEEVWKEFIDYGSGFKLEAERDYKTKREPVYYHLFMYGLVYPTGYEIVGTNLKKLLLQTMKDGNQEFKRLKQPEKEV